MLKLGWFSTGRGPGSRNLLKAVMDEKEKGLDVQVSFVFCNWDNTEEPNSRKEQRQMFFDLVNNYNIPLIAESWKKHRPDLWESNQEEWRNGYGALLRSKTSEYGMNLGILAGYMLWMDDETCNKYDMLNLHPALPDGPKGTWQDVIWQLIRDNATDQGAMMHLCTPEWDRGSPLTYCKFSIRGKEYDTLWNNLNEKLKSKSLDEIIKEEGTEEPLFKKIREDGAKRELPLIVETIRKFAEGIVEIKDKKLFVNGKTLDTAFDLSEEVNSSIGV